MTTLLAPQLETGDTFSLAGYTVKVEQVDHYQDDVEITLEPGDAILTLPNATSLVVELHPRSFPVRTEINILDGWKVVKVADGTWRYNVTQLDFLPGAVPGGEDSTQTDHSLDELVRTLRAVVTYEPQEASA